MNRTLDGWMTKSREELDGIYARARSGPLPTGDMRGTAIVAGSPFARALAHLARRLAWQGKVFDTFADGGHAGVLVNKVLPLGLGLVVAKVYRGTSWMDGRETIVIDYSRTSLLARAVRDEIREVEPGLYLGKVWWGRTRVLDFALSAASAAASREPAAEAAAPREESRVTPPPVPASPSATGAPAPPRATDGREHA